MSNGNFLDASISTGIGSDAGTSTVNPAIGNDFDRHVAYWRDALAGAPAMLELPTDRPRSGRRDPATAGVAVAIDPELTVRLDALAARHDATLQTVLLAAWAATLARLSSQDDVVIGVPTDGDAPAGSIGDVLPLRIDLSGQPSVAELLARVGRRLRDAFAHAVPTFEGIVASTASLAGALPAPVFQSVLALRDADAPSQAQSPGVDLALNLRGTGEGIAGELCYAVALFDADSVERYLGHWQRLLRAMTLDETRAVSRLPILGEEERRLVLETWNATSIEYPHDACMHELFEAQVVRSPDAVALVAGSSTLSYAQLNERANRLAHHLRALGLGPDERVGICVQRNAEMLVALLASLKSGAAYVPLDPAYPADRLGYMLDDAMPRVVLTDAVGGPVLAQALALAEQAQSLAVLDLQADAAVWANAPGENPSAQAVGLHSRHLAYLIYTSGSTGRPKGVAIEHRNGVNFICWALQEFSPDTLRNCLFSTSINFDLSIYEYGVPLSCGGCVTLVDNALTLLNAALPVTLINTVPSVMMELTRAEAIPPSVRVVNVAGEPLKRALAERIIATPQVEQLCNLYGPSETTTYSTWTRMDRSTGFIADVGRPVGNTQVYILDEAGTPAPVGVAGEIFIGGHGVARGYLGKPELTADRFLDDPFSAEPGARMYKTGDLGRWSNDGTITLLGRNDFQVKIRGFRIELGEIEARLGECAGVREAVVVARDDDNGGKRLVAYCLADEALDIAAIREHVASALPEYMMPSAFVRLEAWPLTANGKLDRKALPAPDDDAYTRRAYEAPQGEIETTLASIWSDLLRLEKIGRNDDFFELGGHSLLAVQLVSRVRKALDVELTFRDVFEASELRELGERLPRIAVSSLSQIVPVARRPLMQMPQIVRGFWVMTQLGQATSAHHIGGAYRLAGDLDRPALERSWRAIIARHEILRIRFIQVDGEPMLGVDQTAPFDLRFQDIRGAEDTAARCDTLYSELYAEPFDLGHDVPLRAQVLQLDEHAFELQWVTHHIVSDGWSIGVMLKELSEFYAAETGHAQAALPALPVQYLDYAFWKGEHLPAAELDRQVGYWRDTLAGAPPLLELPTDRPRPPQQDFAGAAIDLHLGEALTTRLKALSRRHGVTLYMTILASWAAVFSRLSGQSEVVIGSPMASRSREEIEPLIGFFINTLALRIDLDSNPSTGELLTRTRQRLLDAQAHGDVLFDRVVEALKPPRNSAYNQMFQVMLAWQSQDEGELALPGIEVLRAPKAMKTAQLDLLVDLREKDGCISGFLNYMTALFDRETIERFVGYWQRLLTAMADDDAAPVSALPLLGEAERGQVLHRWNATAQPYPRDTCVGELFAAQAAAQPDAVALVWGEQRVSYDALNRRANRLAHWLGAQGIGRGARVALSLSRGVPMVETLLGVLKAGAAYVPMAPDLPAARVAFMLDDAQPALLIADASAQLPGMPGVPVARLETLAEALSAHPDHDPALAQMDATQLAYVIYTSGTTGTPKGVQVSHRNVVNFCCWCRDAGLLAAGVRMTQFAPYTFDASAGEIFAGLLGGAELHLLDEATIQSPQRLQAYLLEQRIGFAALPPAYLQQLDPALAPAGMKLLTAGSAPTPELVRRWAGRGEYVNGYGPTETTILSTTTALSADEARISIGRPIANTRVYVLDAHRQPVPVGVTGELWIGGDGVTPGYLNRDALTEERYVADPFCSEPGGRMYRTGDLGRWSSDGSLEFAGRNDFQVKIRGFRIELGEIEARLVECPGVGEAVVVAREEGGEPRLVAYCLSDGTSDETLDAGALRERLASQLPEYMVPAAFVQMHAWPLTAHGKLDRKALPAPDDSAYARRAYEAPQGEIEHTLAQLWSQLLRVEQVGRHDGFFELGGHSLLAVQLSSRVRQTLGVELPLRWVFEAPVLSQLAQRLATGETAQLTAIAVAERRTHMPLSLAQQRLWFLTQLDGASAAYHTAGALRLTGRLDVAALERSLQRVVARHESLRTRFVLVDGQPMQRVDASASVRLRFEDLRGEHNREALRTARGEALYAEPFDLSADPPLRVMLMQLEDEDYGLYVVVHHIVSDGWSIGVMLEELSRLYTAEVEGAADPLPPLPIQYIDYAQWQRQWLADGQLERQVTYWREALAGAPTLLEVPTDRPRPPYQSFAGSALDVVLDATLTAQLKALSQRHGVTLYMTLLASWAALLGRLSGQDEVVIGSPMAGRNRAEIEPLVGFFVNTLALRIELGGEPTVAELLTRTRRRVLDAQSHQDLPFDHVVEVTKPVRSTAHTPIFQVMLAWQNQNEARLSMPGVATESLEQEASNAQFELILNLREQGEEIVGALSYMTSLFDETTVARYFGYWRRLLAGMTQDDTAAMARLPLLGAAERHRLLNEWNATERSYPDTTVHALFEAQAQRSPDAIALSYEDGAGGNALSYAELNRRANRLAHHLIAMGVAAEDRIAICMERSLDMVVGLLAILKSGAAYVPIDPSYPHHRLRHMLDDCAPKAALSHGQLTQTIAALAAASEAPFPVLDLDRLSTQSHSDANPSVAVSGSHLAYMIYTSGSTGLPKGAMNEHRGVVNRLLWAQDQFGLDASDRVLQKTTFGFDVSVWEFFLPLLAGARVTLARPGGHQDPAYLVEMIEHCGITVMHFVPSMLQAFLTQSDLARCGSLRHVKCSGEALPYALQQRFRAALPHAQLHNLYGPTEAAVDVTYWRCVDDAHAGTVPIGKPVANTSVYLLDAHGEPVPVGVAGELHIGGVQVGRGYRNRAELTAERFIADPYSRDPRARLYRSGDLARWLPDGNVEYLGRNDFQVKIRGFRIELGEIEAKLAECEHVREAVVLAREDVPGEKRLVAYLTMSVESSTAVADLRAQLLVQLPDYMVPSAFVILPSLPLTPNGKLDRKALPAPDGAAYARRGHAAPQGHVEATLAKIWIELLKLDRVGRFDDFFELGGHSLLAVQLATRVRDALDVELNLRDVFEASELACLAERVSLATSSVTTAIEIVQRQPYMPLSPAQQRLWFLTQVDGASAAYHSAGALRLTGALDRGALARALRRIVERHEILRTRFVLVEGEPMQQFVGADAFDLRLEDVRAAQDPEGASQALGTAFLAQPFDLGAALPIRMQLVQIAHDVHALHAVLHHIVSDGWSIGVLLDELGAFYALEVGAAAQSPAPLPVQYIDYAQWQWQWLAGGPAERQAKYWRETLAGAPTLLELPTDRARAPHQDFAGAAIGLHLDETLYMGLKRLSQRYGTTLYMTLLASWAAVLSRLSGQDEVVIGSPVAGRARTEIEPLIGFFVNTLPLRIDLSGEPTVAELLSRTRAQVLDAQAHQDLPFDRIVEAVKPPRSTAHSPVFQVMLAWQSQAEGRLHLAGIDVAEQALATTTAPFELILDLRDTGSAIEGALGYMTSLFDAETVSRYAEYWQRLLHAMAADGEAFVARLPLLGAAESARMLSEWNATALAYPREACLHDLFEAQAQRTPDAIALVAGEERLSYDELNRRANRLSRHLRSLGVAPDDRVGLCLERNAGMMVALLATLKSGGAYVPLDPAYPPDRLAQILDDATPRVVLADAVGLPVLAQALDRAENTSSPVIVDIDTDAAQWENASDENVAVAGLRSSNLAYLIYTSGSTGRPKGVAIEHRNAVNFLSWATGAFSAHDLSNCLFSTSINFDLSLFEYGAPLSVGGTVTLVANALTLLDAAHPVTLINTVPSAMAELTRAQAIPPSVRVVNVAGEALKRSLAERILASANVERLCNLYGPSETTTYSTWTTMTRDSGFVGDIGGPVGNTQVYVLDTAGAPVPIGVAGEIWIAGAGVARGYLGQPELTAERFVCDPFAADPAARMYCTGDLGRWSDEGKVTLLGRNDFQVKIRGFRIELGEVESKLVESLGVREAVVLAREDAAGEKRLVAYCLADETLDIASVREHLAKRLPEYMLPSAFVRLPAWPLTPNGKLDRKALPAPDDSAYARRAFEAPQSETERGLAVIWAELLAVEAISRFDDFFELGGHSLLAVQLASRVRKTFDVDLSMRELFELPTLSRLAAHVAAGQRSDQSAILPAARQAFMPLSQAQRRLWFLSQIDGASAAYHLSGAQRLRGALDLAALSHALDQVVARHDVLRTRFVLVDGQPMQQVAAHAAADLRVRDLRGHDDVEAANSTLNEALFAQAFDLEHDPLLRVQVAQLGENDFGLAVVMHHIISDGWSIGVMLEELSRLYVAKLQGDRDPLPPLPVQYVDYAQWQRQWLADGQSQRQVAYWREALSGAPALLELPTDRPRPSHQDFSGAALELSLDADLTARLRALSHRHGATLYMTLLASWAAVLGRLSGQDEVVIGSPVAGRNRVEIEPLIGFFVNTLALRIDLAGTPTVAELLARTRGCVLEAQSHQDLPFDQVVEAVKPPRNPSHTPVFQTLLAWQTQDEGQLSLPGIEATAVATVLRTAQFDLTLGLRETAQGIEGGLNYATALFDRATVARYADYWQRLLTAMADDDAAPVSALPLLGEAERGQVLHRWNATAQPYPRDTCVGELFAAQAAAQPDAVALVWGEQRVSYDALNRRANRLAHWLGAQGIGRGARVALSLSRGVPMVETLLGVLKAGAAYVPMAPDLPAARVAFMLDDAQPALLIADASAQLPDVTGVPVARLETLAEALSAHPDHDPALAQMDATQLAYVIYTSGTTGTPKGVQVSHRNVVNFCCWCRDAGLLAAGVRMTQFAPYTFDASAGEIFAGLLGGAELHLLDEATIQSPQRLQAYLLEQRIGFAALPPAYLQQLDPALAPAGMKLLTAGSAPTPELVRRWAGRGEYVNGYGPTETTILSTTTALSADEARISIGRPIANTRVYVLDAHRQPVPVGVTGELWIGGDGVTPGYLNRDALTEERYVADPFCSEPGGRMYRTGDLGRWSSDGSLEFAGRNDFQVKIRGFRIELGEIEARLVECPGVGEAVVVAREEGGEPRLVAYCLGDGTSDEGVDAGALRERLASQLPEYMVPAAFVQMHAWPLTAHGKLDRKALPAPDDSAYARRAYEAPQGEIEHTLAQLWSQLLRVEQVGRHDGFFELGGHSLLAVQLSSRVRQTLGVELPLRWVFEAPVLSQLAQRLATGETAQLTAIAVAERRTHMPLSLAQQRLWFLTQIDGASAAYHSAGALRLSGRLNVDALERSLRRIVARHESLRTRFVLVDGQPMQKIDAEATLQLRFEDLRGEQNREALRAARGEAIYAEAFDLRTDLPLRVLLVQLEDEDYALYVVMHHIVSDGWSIGVMLEELSRLYTAEVEGAADPLPPLPIQYIDYAQWQRQWLADGQLERQTAYWREALAGAPTLLEVPTDRPRPAHQNFAGAALAIDLDAGLTASLKALSQRHGVTLYMTLLASWAALLGRLSGQDEVVIGSPMAGRNRAEIEPLIGFFVNTLALRIDLGDEPTVAELLARTRRQVLDAQSHQDLPFDHVVEVTKPVRSTAHTPIFQVMLAWQNQDEARLSMPGIATEGLAQDTSKARFDLALDLGERDGAIVGALTYMTALFDEATAARYAGYWQRLLAGMAQDESMAVARLPLLDEAERMRMLHECNAARETHPESTVHALFEAQARRTPDAPALICEDDTLSYAQLNRRANQVAHRLVALGVQPDDRVAICTERSLSMIVGLLGILKAGAAYVPLDPSYPADRLAYMLEDSRPRALLTQAQVHARLPLLQAAQAPVLVLDNGSLDAADAHDPSIAGLTSRHLAYVIYTSGSTGQPKGVMVEHRSPVNFWRAMRQTTHRELAPNSRVALNAAFSFDMSLKGILQLLSGHCVVLVPQAIRANGPALLAFFDRYRIEAMDSTPSQLEVLLSAGLLESTGHRPTSIYLGGEPVGRRMWERLKASPKIHFHNMYGPTECTVDATIGSIRESLGGPVIGKPILNTPVYVLDAYGEPSPVGVPGEMFLGGVQVARGYLGLAELTGERFLRDPFAMQAGARMYKTGDLARWTANGELEYLGRNDFQVKIRGFRIELGEIEAKLAACTGVHEAAVVAREDASGEKRLVAYVTLRSGATSAIADLRTQLLSQLPDYMVPAAFVVLPSLPLTPNGKLDRKALPAPDDAAYARREYEAPQGRVETALATIWADLLHVDRVGRSDDFFELGGHSLMVLVVIDRLAALGIELKIPDIYRLGTVQAIAAAIEADSDAAAADLTMEAWLDRRGWSYRAETVEGRRTLRLSPATPADIAALKKFSASLSGAANPSRIVIGEETPAASNARFDQRAFLADLDASLAQSERAIRAAGVAERYAFSEVQKSGIEWHDRVSQHVVPVNGWWSADELRAAFAVLVRSQDMLRAAADLDTLSWDVLEPAAFRAVDVPWLDLRQLSSSDADAAWPAIVAALHRAQSTSRLCHAAVLLSHSDTEHRLLMVNDHLISDGRSFEAIADGLRRVLIGDGEPTRGCYREFVAACAQEHDPSLLERLALALDNTGMAQATRATADALAANADQPTRMLVIEMPAASSDGAAKQAFDLFRTLVATVTGLDRFAMAMTHHGRQLANRGFAGQFGLFLDKIPVAVGPESALEDAIERANLLHRQGVRFLDWYRSGDARVAGTLASAQSEVAFNFQRVAGQGLDHSHVDFQALHAKIEAVQGVVFDAYAGSERLDAILVFKGSNAMVEEVNALIASAGGMIRTADASAGADPVPAPVLAAAPILAVVAPSVAVAEPAIVVQDVYKRYGDVEVVKGLTFSVPKGTCFGILGPNGAGKTSLLGMIEGIVPITSGRITMLGMDVGTQIRKIQPRLGVQLQSSNYFQFLTVEELLTFYSQYRAAASGKRRLDTTARLLDRLDLADKMKFKVDDLSGGQKQRLSIAIALLGDPDILFLDEPSAALDPHSRRHLWEFIEELKQERTRTIVLTTHYMEEAERLCDEIMIMNQGKIVDRGDPKSLVAQLNATQQVVVKLGIGAPGEEIAVEMAPKFVATWDAFTDSLRIPTDDVTGAIRQILSITEARGVAVAGIQVDRLNLEDVFLNKTGKELKS
ncbi:non-ribosomal peptide synthase/polyketide synthase [Xanthomonas sp. JAI131]|uniref:non-ribosomal peptide synthase/polyketide synthase n=1 Tax=Xanthomonas sp. JAI131 TaxID=2723067 RepID=UPI0021040C31|nr:non-ribosomal peptide synthase/polyketide synthase [Xanthomonas sp. JAI131]